MSNGGPSATEPVASTSPGRAGGGRGGGHLLVRRDEAGDQAAVVALYGSAAGRLNQALDLVEKNRGGGGLNVVFTAARELSPWRNERTVQEVNDRLLALMTAG